MKLKFVVSRVRMALTFFSVDGLIVSSVEQVVGLWVVRTFKVIKHLVTTIPKNIAKKELTKVETEKAPKIPHFHGCTKCTAIHGAILSERGPENSWETLTLETNEKIYTSKFILGTEVLFYAETT